MFVTTYAHLEATIIHRQSGLLTFVTEDFMFDFKAISEEDNPTLTFLVFPVRLYTPVSDEIDGQSVAFYKKVLRTVKQLAFMYMQDRGCASLIIRVYGSPLKRPYQVALEERNFTVRKHKDSSWEWTGGAQDE